MSSMRPVPGTDRMPRPHQPQPQTQRGQHPPLTIVRAPGTHQPLHSKPPTQYQPQRPSAPPPRGGHGHRAHPLPHQYSHYRASTAYSAAAPLIAPDYENDTELYSPDSQTDDSRHQHQYPGRARHRLTAHRTPTDSPRPSSPSKSKSLSLCSRSRAVTVLVVLVALSLIMYTLVMRHRSHFSPAPSKPTIIKHSEPALPGPAMPTVIEKLTNSMTPVLHEMHTRSVQQPETEPDPEQPITEPTKPAAADPPPPEAAGGGEAETEAVTTPTEKPVSSEASDEMFATPTKSDELGTPPASETAKQDRLDLLAMVKAGMAAQKAADEKLQPKPDTKKPVAAKPTKTAAKPDQPLGNDKAVPLMSQSVFPRTDDGYPVFSSPASPNYSSFYCIGGRGREGSAGDRSCRFQNLCYRPSTSQWLFYQNPETKGTMPILLDHGRIVSEFPTSGFLNLRSMGNPQDAKLWSPTQVYESIPPAAFVPRKDSNRPDVYLLYHSHYPSNIGHIIGDDFFPLFNLQLSFGMLSNNNHLLMVRDCDKIFLPKEPGKAEKCHHFMPTLSPGMSRWPVLAATQSDLVEMLGITDIGSDVVCFDNVLAGNGPYGFQQSLGKAPSWWQYHHYYLTNMGLSPNHTPKKHRITVSIKDGKRSIYNNQPMVEHLKAAFPDYEIDAIELYKLGGWQQELQYLLDTTVLITPCGGVSMSSMFLPHGSAMIVVDYWNVNKNNTVGMEEKLWANLGFVRAYHYPFYEHEVVLDEAGRERGKYQDMRDWGRVNVDLQRMEVLVRDAIHHVDSFMVMGQE